MQVLLIVILVFLSSYTVTLAIYSLFKNRRIIILQRLNSIGINRIASVEDEELSMPFHSRILKPLVKNLSEFLVKITPREISTGLETKIAAAGNPFDFGVKEWLSLQFILTIILPAATIMIGSSSGMDLKRMIIVTAAEFMLGILTPRLVLSTKTKERQKEINKTLPDILDLLTVSVEAGLGFDAALGKVVEKAPGVLSKELDKALQEIKIGKSRKEALKDASSRIGIVDFTTLIASIIQAEQLGVGIGNVLRIQSHQMRLKRRQRAQEKAMKAPVKMLIPMVMFIFPTIFTVILGPSVIKLLDTFFKK